MVEKFAIFKGVNQIILVTNLAFPLKKKGLDILLDNVLERKQGCLEYTKNS